MTYRVVRSPWYRQADYALARRYSTLAEAFADMGDGLILDEAGEVVAFHERHLPLLKRLAKS